MARIAGPPRGEGVQAVVLALQLLDYMARQNGSVGVTALGQALGTSKSRVYRHLRTLLEQGYVVQAPDTEKYRVGPRLTMLGRLVSRNADIAAVAREPMLALRDALGQSVVVSQLDADGMRVLATLPGHAALEIGVKPGSLLDFHATAQGKVALAFGGPGLCDRVCDGRLQSLTPHTIVDAAALRTAAALVRRMGWAASANETALGINALAAPVFEAGGPMAGTMAIVGSVQFIPPRPTQAQIDAVVAAAAQVSVALGHSI